jgi:hypothetical protein
MKKLISFGAQKIKTASQKQVEGNEDLVDDPNACVQL